MRRNTSKATMPPEAVVTTAEADSVFAAAVKVPTPKISDAAGNKKGQAAESKARESQEKVEEVGGEEEEVLVDDKGRPYNLGPKGFVRDLNTRAVKIARRVAEQSRATTATTTASFTAVSEVVATDSKVLTGGVGSRKLLHNNSSSSSGTGDADLGASGTVRSAIAQEIQFVLGGRLPFVKRSEVLVWCWSLLSLWFICRYGILQSGIAPTVGAFVVMYFVLDFYSGVLHVVLDDEWNMKVPLLSQPAMEFQYHHHIPDDGCSRPFVEGMGDLNFIIGLHLALFTAVFVLGGGENTMLLCAGGWKMLIAYWGIWNHRQVRVCACLAFCFRVQIEG